MSHGLHKAPRCRRRAVESACVAAIASLVSSAALAQRVDENTVTQAEDAFGISVSGEELGLYNADSVRGFSPTDAGNIRVEGLYYDQQTDFTSRLVGGYRILVGSAVLGHPFPAPTGVVDYHLRNAGDKDILSIASQADSFGGRQIEFDGQLQGLVPNVGLAGGLGLYDFHQGFGGTQQAISMAVVGRWKLSQAITVTPFWSRIANTANEAQPTIIVQDGAMPSEPNPRHFAGQPWASSTDTGYNFGILTDANIGGFLLRAGVFRSTDDSPISYSPQFNDTTTAGLADRSVIAEQNKVSAATSGEIQLSRAFAEGPFKHLVYAAVWARDQDRRYGATDEVDIGPGYISAPQSTPAPAFTFGPQSRDHVAQLTVGMAYEGAWDKIAVLNLGVEKTHYEKSVASPDLTPPTARYDPWLFNAALAVHLTPSLTLYSGTSRGLEESDIAPSVALNRDEAPPAIRTSQTDAGVRWAVSPRLTLVTDVFQIEKPYYGLDQAMYFRALGQVTNKGLEASFTGTPLPGFDLVAGALVLDADVTGEQVAAGRVGAHPVGSSPLTLIASVNYRPPQFRSFSLDMDWERDGQRVLDVEGATHLPSRYLVNLGARYRFAVEGKPAIFRIQATNLFNVYNWDIVGSDSLQTHDPRAITASLTIDL